MDTLDRLWEAAEANRRQRLARGAGSGVVTGYAAAAQPVMTQTMVITDATGLTQGKVEIPASNGPVAAYRAMPAAPVTPRPLVLVVQEIFGLHEHIKDVCRRFAKLGFMAIAPSLYDRQGDVTKLDSIDEIRPIVARVPDAQVMSDLDATVAWAANTGMADPAKVAVTGFCWGGRITWLYAAHNPTLCCGVAWYGRLTGDKTENQPAHPVDLAANLKAPVLGLYGGQDAGIPLETVQQMRTSLGAGSRSTIHVYPESPHAFFADYRPSYRRVDAEDGWRRCVDWMNASGVS
jgi:carboxymethylenebutenolidase